MLNRPTRYRLHNGAPLSPGAATTLTTGPNESATPAPEAPPVPRDDRQATLAVEDEDGG